ncbi:MAG TPA: hypothetical protein VGN79_09165 [Devosia sp.]|jgi:hypothetical protein|nr:hypothetical protein [Devosia sp.]
MPLFYFDLIDGENITEDQAGTDLPDASAARRQATSHIIEAARDLLPNGGAERDISIRVRDQQQDQVLEVSISFKVHAAPGSEFPQ